MDYPHEKFWLNTKFMKWGVWFPSFLKLKAGGYFFDKQRIDIKIKEHNVPLQRIEIYPLTLN